MISLMAKWADACRLWVGQEESLKRKEQRLADRAGAKGSVVAGLSGNREAVGSISTGLEAGGSAACQQPELSASGRGSGLADNAAYKGSNGASIFCRSTPPPPPLPPPLPGSDLNNPRAHSDSESDEAALVIDE